MATIIDRRALWTSAAQAVKGRRDYTLDSTGAKLEKAGFG
jgi:hypothetical protein